MLKREFMNNDTTRSSLPEKVVRRHAEMIEDLLPEFERLVTEEGRPADALLNHHLRSHRELGSRDRRFLSTAVFSYFRWRGWTINQLGLSPARACLLGAALDSDVLAQSFQYLEGRHPLPFPAEAMGAKMVEEKRVALNELFKEQADFTPLELVDLAPPELADVIDPEALERALAEFQQRPPTWIRARGDVDELTSALAEHGVSATLHAHVPSAIAVDAGASLAHLLVKQAGRYVVQDIASQCVGLAAAPEKGSDWWDCCAGAGGKTLQLMDLMGGEGKILATDVRLPALKELKKRARKLGVKNIRVQPFNAARDEPFKKTFDGVMVDAPCSGWGTWSRNPDARWRTSRRDVTQCAARQLNILNNVKWCVKPGGLLIYAVCSITRPETEEVVMKFLDQHKDFQLEPFASPLTGEPTDGQTKIWPWEGPGDGMYIARLRRDPA